MNMHHTLIVEKCYKNCATDMLQREYVVCMCVCLFVCLSYGS